MTRFQLYAAAACPRARNAPTSWTRSWWVSRRWRRLRSRRAAAFRVTSWPWSRRRRSLQSPAWAVQFPPRSSTDAGRIRPPSDSLSITTTTRWCERNWNWNWKYVIKVDLYSASTRSVSTALRYSTHYQVITSWAAPWFWKWGTILRAERAKNIWPPLFGQWGGQNIA